MRTFVIRSPSPDSAELVIGNGDHTCEVFPLTFEQVRLISMQAARCVAYWPAEEMPIPTIADIFDRATNGVHNTD